MSSLHPPGAEIALRYIFNGRISYAQAVTVIHDRPHETALCLLPGAQCVASASYFEWGHGDTSRGTRWDEMKAGSWNLRDFSWHTNRFVLLLWPEKFYSIYLIWNQAQNDFVCYYVNFQIPYSRSQVGFDSFDLELDIVIDADFNWKWKDVEDYQDGIHSGCIRPEWVRAIDAAKSEVFTLLEKRAYPFDGSWRNWEPAPALRPAQFPPDWRQLE